MTYNFKLFLLVFLILSGCGGGDSRNSADGSGNPGESSGPQALLTDPVLLECLGEDASSREAMLQVESFSCRFANGNSVNWSELANLPQLTELKLTPFFLEYETTDLSFLYSLTQLEKLDLSDDYWDGGGPTISDSYPTQGIVTSQRWIEPVSSLVNLKSLDLSGIFIDGIDPLSGLTGLESLKIEHHAIEDLASLAGLVALKNLNISNPLISRIENTGALFSPTPFRNLKNIDGLSSLTNLEILNLYNNDVDDLRSLLNLKKINTLNLAQNSINDIDPLNELSNLETLDITQNPIKSTNSLNGILNLKKLELSSTENIMFNNLSTLESLSIKGFAGRPPIYNEVDPGDTEITSIEMDSLQAIEIIEILDMDVNLLSLSNLENLEDVRIFSSRVETFSGNNLPSLNNVYSGYGGYSFSDTYMPTINIMIQGAPKLRYFNDLDEVENTIVNGSQLQSFRISSSAKRINLDNNYLTNISSVSDLPDLVELSLGNNCIEDFSMLSDKARSLLDESDFIQNPPEACVINSE